MLSIALDDVRRDYGDGGDYVYLACYPAVSVFSGVTNSNTLVTEYQGSGQGVYFLVPTSAL